jgi:hypothetical protein
MFGQTYWGARIYEQIYHIGLDRDVLGRRHAADINRNFLRWISYSQRPFFSVLNYFDVHDPYLPPEPYRHQYSKVKNPGWYSSRSWVADLTPEQRQTAVDAYDGAINYVDAQLEALFAELQKRGLDKNTIVLVTSDHGESFGEHGFSNHGNALYRELIRVPLVVWAPGRVPSGKRVPRPVSLVELPATLVDLAGVHSPLAFRGPSMARLWGEGPPPALEPPVSELAELKWNPKFPNYYGPMVSITTADWHYISGGKDRVELYHCCESDVEQMDLAQTALGGPIARILSSELVAEGGWDPVSGVAPREFRYTAERAPDALSIADVNDDGNPDIAVAERGGGAIVLLGDGTGRFSPAPPEMNARARFGHAGLEARADLNGNGTEDIALADRAHRTIRFYFRRPDGRMATSTLPLDVSPDFIALADVNHNGLPDLVIASREKNSIIVLLSGPAAPARHVAELAGK